MALITVTCHKIDEERFAKIRAAVDELAEELACAGVEVEALHHCSGDRECDEGMEHGSPRMQIRITTAGKETLADLVLTLDTYLLLRKLFCRLDIENHPGTISVICLLDGPQYCPECHTGELVERQGAFVCTKCGFSKPA
ncbi:MAG: hypothetical protein NT039_01825 [Candidatus Berkelbacteria bacterium]|nr:hypothetical protein [Candidatus Berkelbacteria bacterium]